MKLTCYILLCVILQQYSIGQINTFEEAVYQCFQQNDDFNHFNTLLSEFEDSLIEHRVLLGKKGQDYKLIYETITSGSLESTISRKYLRASDNIFDSIKRSISECKTRYSLEDYKHSASHLLNKSFDSLVKNSSISSKNVANSILQNLTTEDFNTPYYKTTTLLLLQNILNSSPYEKQHSNINIKKYPKHTLSIVLTKDNLIQFNDTTITLNIVYNKTINYVLEQEKDATITLKASSETTFNFYLEILSTIENALVKAKNISSKQRFNLPYKDLQKTDKAIIDKKIRFNLIELPY